MIGMSVGATLVLVALAAFFVMLIVGMALTPNKKDQATSDDVIRCSQCGRRIGSLESPVEREGKVFCPECSGKAEPDFRGLVAPASGSAKQGPVPCGNCGRMVGRLEKALFYEGEQVCSECYTHLSGDSVEHAIHPGAPGYVTTQRTGKDVKGAMLLGAIVALGGLALGGAGQAALGVLFLLVGGSLLVVSMIVGWWKYG